MKTIYLFLILGLVLLSALFVLGCISNPLDKCQRDFDKCNHDCGEGILSSICKEKCTYNYNKCKEQNK